MEDASQHDESDAIALN